MHVQAVGTSCAKLPSAESELHVGSGSWEKSAVVGVPRTRVRSERRDWTGHCGPVMGSHGNSPSSICCFSIFKSHSFPGGFLSSFK